MTDPVDFPISEKKAAAQLGLTRDESRALRNLHLTEGTHFARGRQSSVWLNQAGLDVLMATVRVLPEKTAPAPPADDLALSRQKLIALLRFRAYLHPPPPPDYVRLLVVKAHLPNTRMVLACPVDDDPERPQKTVRVRVKSSANFIRRMEIPARLVAGYTDLYDLARNCPRAPGKW